MREDQARFVLGQAGADAGPPLGIEVTELVRRGRRARRVRRRMVVAGSSLATATAAGLVALALVLVHQPAPPGHVTPANTHPTPMTPATTMTTTTFPGQYETSPPTGTANAPGAGNTLGTTTNTTGATGTTHAGLPMTS